MARRRSAKQDSLELLLDTICNTFGGVLFIAILVVLLLQQTGAGPAAPTSTSKTLSAVEMVDLTNRFEELTSELTRLRENHESQHAVVQTFATTEIRELLAERVEVTQKQNELQQEVDQLLINRAELAVKVEELTRENEAIPGQLQDARAREQQLSAKLDELMQSNSQELRLPVLEVSHRPVIGMIMKYGRLYLWNLSNSVTREGLNHEHFVAVGTEKKDVLITIPHPLRGVELDESPQCRDNVRKLLAHISPKTFDLAIVVRPDSFHEFRYLRDTIVDLGFKYYLYPISDGEPIYDAGGSGDGRVQ